MYTYALINLFSILGPLLLSFEKRISYYKKWKYFFPAAIISSILFLIWDEWFASLGVWGFNSKYLLGIYIGNLPLEEVLFFFCIPFSCTFIYELVLHFHKGKIKKEILKAITVSLGLILCIVATLNLDKTYTSLNFYLLASFLLINLYCNKGFNWKNFYVAYLFSLVPFLIVNGILTNGLRSVDKGPVVWYNSLHILGVRILGIPIEDFFYSMLMLLIVFTIYEKLKEKY